MARAYIGTSYEAPAEANSSKAIVSDRLKGNNKL